MTAIIFGAKGQDGIYLSALLSSEGINVVAVNRPIEANDIDIVKFDDVCKIVQQHTPDYIFHLAANSTTNHKVWQENHNTISTGALNILEAVRLYSINTKVFLSGSGLQFENTGLPINENDIFIAKSMYAVSRIHTVYAARYYRTLGIKAYVGYFFNHDSEFRSERHINKKIIEAAKRIADGSTEKLQIGNLNVQKEFGFSGDIISGILKLVRQDNYMEAVIGTGKAYPIKKWVEICFEKYGLNWQQHVETDVSFTSEYEILVSDPATIFSLGWQPKTDIYKLAEIMNQ